MKRFVFATLAAVVMIGGASAREVAFCDGGYDLALIPGDKAVCQKKAKEWVFHSNRLCTPGMNYKPGKEADDGGDMCTGAGGVVDLPALPCGLGERTVLKRNDRDVCQKEKEVTSFGNVRTRQE